MFNSRRNFTVCTAVAVSGLLLASTTGCVGLLANIMHAANGNLAPAAFDDLAGKRVAVLCLSDSEAFGPTEASMDIASRVSKLLETNVDEIMLVPSQEIADWVDRNDWDQLDYSAVGRGVNADMVVVVDLETFSLRDGKTLYKGRSDLKITAYDMNQDAQRVFTAEPSQIQFPTNSGYHTTDISEDDFNREFIAHVSRRVARNFYPYDIAEDYAEDVTLIR